MPGLRQARRNPTPTGRMPRWFRGGKWRVAARSACNSASDGYEWADSESPSTSHGAGPRPGSGALGWRCRQFDRSSTGRALVEEASSGALPGPIASPTRPGPAGLNPEAGCRPNSLQTWPAESVSGRVPSCRLATNSSVSCSSTRRVAGHSSGCSATQSVKGRPTAPENGPAAVPPRPPPHERRTPAQESGPRDHRPPPDRRCSPHRSWRTASPAAPLCAPAASTQPATQQE